jgi:hypothetical protein
MPVSKDGATGLAQVLRNEAAAFNDALEGADGDLFAAVHGNDDLPPVGMALLLVAAALAHAREAMLAEDPEDIIGVSDCEATTQELVRPEIGPRKSPEGVQQNVMFPLDALRACERAGD